MRILLIGSPAARARLHAQLNAAEAEVRREDADTGSRRPSGLRIVGEFPSVAAARRARASADAWLVAPEIPGANDPLEDVAVQEEALTPREIEVLGLLAEGLPNKAIAERLHISAQTVKFHVGSIAGKLGASNRTDAVRRAVRRGLVAL